MTGSLLTVALLGVVSLLAACTDLQAEVPHGEGTPPATLTAVPPEDHAPLASAPLLAMNGSSAGGTVLVRGPEDGWGVVVLVVQAEGLAPRSELAALLRGGSCRQPSASGGQLGAVSADASGRAQLIATHVRAGATGDEVVLEVDLVGDGGHLVELVDASGTRIACADLPLLLHADSPAQPHGPTGNARFDAIVAAARAADVRTLEISVAMTSVPCVILEARDGVTPPPQGAGGPPRCAASEAPNTPVLVLPAAGCEGYYLSASEVPSTLAAFLEGGPRLRSWHLPSAALRFFTGSSHVLLFEVFDARLERTVGRELLVSDAGITGIHLGCGHPPEELAAMQQLDAPLPLSALPSGGATNGAAGSTPLWSDALLEATNGSGAAATAHVEAPSLAAPAEVSIDAQLDPGMSYVVHVHGGSCGDPSASLRRLGLMSADAEGNAAMRSRLDAAPEAPALTLEAMADGTHVIEIHGHQGTVVACGIVPAIEQR